MRSVTEKQYNETIPGWSSPYDLDILEQLASSVPAGIIVEVGSMHGRSAYTLAKANPLADIFCIDKWDNHREIINWEGYSWDNLISTDVFTQWTKDCSNINVIQVQSVLDLQWTQSVDMVFIDAAHSNPVDWEYIEYWLPKIKPNGIICGHDYSTDWPDVIANVERLKQILNSPVKLYKNSSIWSFKIPV